MSYTREGEGALSAAVLSALVSVLGFFDVHLDTWCRPFSVFAAFCIAYDLMPWWAVSVCASMEFVYPTFGPKQADAENSGRAILLQNEMLIRQWMREALPGKLGCRALKTRLEAEGIGQVTKKAAECFLDRLNKEPAACNPVRQEEDALVSTATSSGTPAAHTAGTPAKKLSFSPPSSAS